MRIVIDARMLYWTGVGRYTRALLDNLAALDTATEYFVLTRPADRKLWEPAAPNFRRVEVDINPYSLAEQMQLPRVIARLNPDLVHFTAANAPMLYKGPRVTTVHDLTLLQFDTSRGTGLKRQMRRFKRIPFKRVISKSVWASRVVMTPSQYVKDEVIRAFGVGPDRVRVTLLAADKNLAPAQPIGRLGAGDEFLLNVGNAFPYKNLALAIESMQVLAPTYPKLKLVLTCAPDYFRDELVALAKRLNLTDRIVFTGPVSDGELVSLYREATLYIYPSLAEGFGLQILEAMAAGCPVVASHTSSLPEIGGAAAEYFDPHSSERLAALVDHLLSSRQRLEAMQEAGRERAKHFSWRRTAEQTLAAYQEAARS